MLSTWHAVTMVLPACRSRYSNKCIMTMMYVILNIFHY